MPAPHLDGLEAALAAVPPGVRSKLIVAPDAVHRCYLYPDTVNAETGANNDGSATLGRPWIGYGDSPVSVARAVTRAIGSLAEFTRG